MSNFRFFDTYIKDLYVIESKRYKDKRGYITEVYNKNQYSSEGINPNFVQDNELHCNKGALVGLSYQHPHQQGRLVRASKGRIFAVAVDLRKVSTTYGQYFGVILSDNNDLLLYIPEGFAHGFLTLSDSAKVYYKYTNANYHDEQKYIIWNDPCINIEWPLEEIDKIVLYNNIQDSKLISEEKVML